MAYLTIDVGGTYLKSAILSPNGEVFKGSAFMTESFSNGSKEVILMALQEVILRGLAFSRSNKLDVKGIGIAMPGPFDCYNGVPLMKQKFQSIYGISLAEVLRKISKLPQAIPIRFVQDANSVLEGEIWKGNGQGYDNVAVVTLGTGLGFAHSLNGIVQCNNICGPLISVYKLPYENGILEDYVSRRGILRIYQEMRGINEITGIDVSDLGRRADEREMISLLTFQKAGRILGEALYSILIDKNIQCLLFGGQISRSFQHMEESIRQVLSKVVCLQKISVVKNINDAALLGTLKAILNPSNKT